MSLMARVTFKVSDSLYEDAKRLSRYRQTTLNRFVQQALVAYLEQYCAVNEKFSDAF